MGRWKAAISFLAATLAMGATARANLTARPADAVASPNATPGHLTGFYERTSCRVPPPLRGGSSGSVVADRADLGTGSSHRPSSPLAPRPAWTPSDSVGGAKTTVLTVPPPPSSLELILSGLVSLGAARFARSAYHADFARLVVHLSEPDVIEYDELTSVRWASIFSVNKLATGDLPSMAVAAADPPAWDRTTDVAPASALLLSRCHSLIRTQRAPPARSLG